MAAAGIRFESERSVEERQEQIRSARTEVLRQAKANFEKEERRKELKRLRGEETWMLPDVIKRVEQISQEDRVKKKKKKDKHSKKVKKEKKKKSKKQKCEKNESTDSSSSSEDEWVEAVPSQTPGKEKAWKIKDEKLEKEDNQIIQRDEWMTVDFMSVKTVSSSSLKAEKDAARKTQQEKTQALEQSRLLERELNPYWKDGGTGLPPEDCNVSSVTKVEDGGLSWLRKSYQRMKEQAEKQNRNFEDIVAERYGSMEVFQLKLKEAEKAAFTKEDGRRERWKKPTYSDRAHSSQESGKSDLVKYSRSSRGRYNTTDIANSITKDKFSGDEKDGRSVFSETYRREPSPRKNQEFSSHVNLRAKFLRPSDDEEVSFHSKDRNFEPSSSSSAVVPQDSVHCGFRKSTENSEESLSCWSQFGRGDRKHSNQKPLETSHSVDHGYISEDVREKSQEEGLRDDYVIKEHLQDTKSSLASSPGDESIHVLSVDEKNKLGAKIIKAEMMGNMELAEQLKAQLDKANKFQDTVTQMSSKKSRVESMEVFQLKLKEAEKAAFTKEDGRRERWKKPTYSDRAHSSQESGKSDLVKYSRSSRGRYNTTDIANSITKDKFSGDEKDGRSVFSETYRREPSPRKNQEFSSHVNLRAKFLRPSDDDEVSFHSKDRNFEPSSSSSAVVPQDSVHCGFRKSTENSEESLSCWSQFGRGDRKHSNQKPLETSHSVDHGYISEDVREKSQEEGLRDDYVIKEHLQDTKSSLASPGDESIHVLSVDEKNKLGAKIIKAEMMGNMELAEQLKAQLDKANKFQDTVTQMSSKKSRVEDEDQEEVILVRTDHSGRVWPVNTPGKQEGRRKRQNVSTHEEKERVRYFHDDDNLSLNDLVKNEKMGTAESHNKLFMRMTSKFMGKTDGDYYTLDDMFVSKAAERERFGEEEENQRKKAIAEHRSLVAQMEKCLYCFDSSQFPKHLIVAIGVKVYLCLPNVRSLTEGHCLIVPLQHHRAATLLDEDIWEEIQMFRKSLVKMFEEKGLDCIFLETNMNMKKQYHMVYECIPLPKEVGDMAPMYFKKAIMESDEEWSINKKLIDLSSKDIRKSVPKGLPYFSVDFGLQGGFAHVIEDQHKFPHYFGKEIIGGMLDIEPRVWRKGMRESFEDQRKKALQFAQWWKPFDFTGSKKC